jgi:ABC-type spermidine/putrescine transport system permease subunit II
MRKQRFGVAWKTVLGIFFMLPVLIAFFFSFLPNNKVLGLPTLETFFEFFTFENYKWVFANIPILKYVSNSLQMCLIVIVAQSITACLAAYAFAFFKSKGKDTLFQIILRISYRDDIGYGCHMFLTIKIGHIATARHMGSASTHVDPLDSLPHPDAGEHTIRILFDQSVCCRCSVPFFYFCLSDAYRCNCA